MLQTVQDGILHPIWTTNWTTKGGEVFEASAQQKKKKIEKTIPVSSTLFKIQLIMLTEKCSKLGQIVLHLLWTGR